MYLLLSLMLAAAPQVRPSDPGRAGAVLFECDFERNWDKDYDDWPDGWARRHGVGYPAYLQIEMTQARGPSSVGCLEMQIDGGGAAVYSPAIDIDRFHAYNAGAKVRTEGLVHDKVFLSLTLLDANRERLEVVYSNKIRDTDGWEPIHLGPIAPKNPQAVFAIIGLHVQTGEWEDLQGTVQWDDVWMTQLPNISLSANKPMHIYTDPSEIRVHCEASGYGPNESRVLFRLEDAVGRVIDTAEKRLQAKNSSDTMIGLKEEMARAVEGSIDWIPPIAGPGFYRVFATIKGDDRNLYHGELTLVVLEPATLEKKGIFGWSLPRGGRPLPLSDLAYLLSQSGVSFIKYPLWFDPDNETEHAQAVVRFCERLGIYNIGVIGMLHDPPASIRERIPHTDLRAAEIFGSPVDLWAQSLEKVVMRMATQVQWWQLGSDEDMSFVGYPNLDQRVQLVKERLDRVGFDVRLGFGWSWLHPYPRASDTRATPWRFMNLSMSPPMTRAEVADYVGASPETDYQQWVALRPLSREHYEYRTRVIDLVERMIEAKIQNASAVFIPEAVSSDQGLINDDGSPGELFLPWRTTAVHLAGGTCCGSMQFPGGSRNIVFQRDKGAVVVLWNESPQTETLYMGRGIRQVDLWGRSVEPKRSGKAQIFQVGPYPTFLVGADMDVVRWRQGFELTQEQIPSVFGEKHQEGFAFKNDSSSGISAKATIRAPDVWQIEPQTVTFTLGEGQTYDHDFEIGLPYNATSGRHGLEIEMEIQTNTRSEEFSIYREIEVGMGDIYILVTTQLNADGELEVQQTFVNESDTRVSFSCRLIAPGRRVQKSEIIGLGHGRDEQVYVLRDGEDLIGETLWIRAQEIGGMRTLNQNFEAKRK